MSFDFSDGVKTLKEDRKKAKLIRGEAKTFISFGIPFLDKASKGISSNDLILVSGDTGIGKSTCGVIISENIAKSGKKVLYFALEMGEAELSMRSEYRCSMGVLLKQRPELRKRYMDFEMFENGDLKEYLEPYQAEIENELSKFDNNLHVKYRTSKTTIEDIKRIMISVSSSYDMFVIDHLGYIDITTKDAQLEQESMMNELKLFTDIHNKPVMIIAHIRKMETKNKRVMPSNHDIAGTKHITNIPSKVIIFAPDYDTEINDYEFSTFVRFSKYRKKGMMTRYVGRIAFDIKTNSYKDSFDVAKLSKDEMSLIELDELPVWAKDNERIYEQRGFYETNN